MKTFMAKAEDVKREWYIVDAAGMPLGRVASQVAALLRGKNKPSFTPHVDTGDHVIVINTDKMVLTGHKLDKEFVRHHTFHSGGLKEVKLRTMVQGRSDDVMYLAVKGMLPKNSLGRSMLTKLRVYKDAAHKHEAQKPVPYALVVKKYDQQ